MNAFDLLILVTLGFSTLIGFARGFVREFFGLGAWGGAVFIAIQDYALPRELLGKWITDPMLLKIGSMFSVFCVALIFFLCIAQWISIIVQQSFAQSVDRSLGLVFGLFRGAILICGAYMGALVLFPISQVPPIVNTSKSIAWLNRGVLFAAPLAPSAVRQGAWFVKNIQTLTPEHFSSDDLSKSLSEPPTVIIPD